MKIGDLIGDKNLKEKFVLQKIICHFCDLSKEDFWLNVSKEISEDNLKKIITGYQDYVDNKKPLEYILGYVQFFGNKFLVNENTLIPRPETEYMINSVNEEIEKRGKIKDERLKMEKEKWIMNNPAVAELRIACEQGRKNVLLDIGTGCGVLGTSILFFNKDFFDKAIFTDISSETLEVAKINFKNLIGKIETDVEFVKSDLLNFLISDEGQVASDELNKEKIALPALAGSQGQINDIVLVANLPYIPEKTFDENAPKTAIKWEPKMAFVGGDDGLDYYKKMFEQIIRLKIKDQRLKIEKIVMFLEMMTWQLDILRNLYSEFFEFEEVKTFHFNIRIVKAWIK